MAEAILANVIALEQAGVPQDEIRIMVGQDGVTVKAGKAILQTPIESRLTDEEGRELVDMVERLDKQLRSGAIPPERIKRICEENAVAMKTEAITKQLS